MMNVGLARESLQTFAITGHILFKCAETRVLIGEDGELGALRFE
jgi:hypothetical protein